MIARHKSEVMLSPTEPLARLASVFWRSAIAEVERRMSAEDAAAARTPVKRIPLRHLLEAEQRGVQP